MFPQLGRYFREQDYAKFSRRLLVDVIDFFVAGLVCFVVFLALWGTVAPKLFPLIFAAILFCYFVFVKRSRMGTLGYRIGGVRIVNMSGERASLMQLAVR